MKLGEKQELFMRLLPRLIDKALAAEVDAVEHNIAALVLALFIFPFLTTSYRKRRHRPTASSMVTSPTHNLYSVMRRFFIPPHTLAFASSKQSRPATNRQRNNCSHAARV